MRLIVAFIINIGGFLNIDSADILNWLLPLGILVGTTFIGWVVEVFVLRRIQRALWHGSSLFVRGMRRQIILWSMLLGVGLALPYSPLATNRNLTEIIHQVLLFLFIVLLTSAMARLITDLIRYSSRPDARPVLSIITNVTSVAVYVIGALIALQVFGISITPAIAALGVTGLAASLALQGTLTDLVSGMQIIVARQIQIGNYVRLSSGEEGYVTDINWRTTCIRQLANNIVIIPNAKMTSSVVINYFQPQKELAILIDVSVSYQNDLDLVERTTIAVAKEVMQLVPGGVPTHEPFIRYDAIEDSNIRFTTIMRGQEYTDQYLIKHEFIKRLHQRYQREGIEIARPIRAIAMHANANGAAKPREVDGLDITQLHEIQDG